MILKNAKCSTHNKIYATRFYKSIKKEIFFIIADILANLHQGKIDS